MNQTLKNYGAYIIELLRMRARASFDFAQDDTQETKTLVLSLTVSQSDQYLCGGILEWRGFNELF
jgi:hypothetical protein